MPPASFTQCGLWSHSTNGTQVTGKDQIEVLSKIGCENAIREIKKNGGNPLSKTRLGEYLEESVRDGYVLRAEKLAGLIGLTLTRGQREQLIKRCLELEWDVDAINAVRMGPVSDQIREALINALVAHGHVNDRAEAIEVLVDHV